MKELQCISILLYVIGLKRHTSLVRWIGREAPVIWPPWSPDLTLLEFLSMDNHKELLYRDEVTTDLFAILHAACTSSDTARRVNSSIPRHAQTCLDMYRGHFGHLSF
ncbi:hypothetical protein TNCV_2795381 [Trichonephila clavipes]|nr:hypothetical protein TNCV_2795381 [Trichonephila clavipes]